MATGAQHAAPLQIREWRGIFDGSSGAWGWFIDSSARGKAAAGELSQALYRAGIPGQFFRPLRYFHCGVYRRRAAAVWFPIPKPIQRFCGGGFSPHVFLDAGLLAWGLPDVAG